MASKIGMSYRNEEAQARINTALPVVVDRLGLDVPGMPSNRRDPILQETLRLEWMADVLDAVDAAIEAMSAPNTKAKAKK